MSKNWPNSEKGAAPVEFALGIAIILVPVAILVLSIAPVFEHYNFARRAAAEAARTLVLSSSDPEGEALTVVGSIAAGFGIDPGDVSTEFCGGAGCGLDRGSVATVEVQVVVREISSFLPVGTFTVGAVQSELVDPYRSRP